MAKKATVKIIRGKAPKTMKVPPSEVPSAMSAASSMGMGTNPAYSDPMMDTSLANQIAQKEMQKEAMPPMAVNPSMAAKPSFMTEYIKPVQDQMDANQKALRKAKVKKKKG